MRTRIETSEVKFRVAGLPKPKQESRANPAQRRTPDGRPAWTVRLTAIDTGSNTSETIWVEVAGDEPKLTLDELAQVHGLVYAPYVNKQTHQIVRAFRAEAVTVLAEARRTAAA
jgi:hypothetical protein